MSENISISKRFASITTDLPPCCLQIHPDNPSIILLGTYKLEDDGKRHGSVDIYHYDRETANLTVLKSYKTDGAILDIKFHTFDSTIVATAHSTGNVILWKLKNFHNEDIELEILENAQLFDTDALITSLFFSPIEPDLILLTLTTGELALTRINNSKLTEPEVFSSTHELECWTGAFGAQGELSNVVFSGGDDATLMAHDLREPTNMSIFKNRRIHEAGVVSILTSSPGTAGYSREWNAANPYSIWTGSYDDCLRSLDLRVGYPDSLIPGMPPAEKKKLNLGGGVWRLIPSPLKNDERVMSCCMYDGARILDVSEDEFTINRYFKRDHESMCYGGDWSNDGKFIVTCSFYDKIVQVWSPDDIE